MTSAKSCCDEMCANHGCNQGRDCPARQACELPELPPRYTQRPARRINLHRVANWLIALLVVCLYGFVQSRDDAYERRATAASDAQAQAMREARKDAAAARMCGTRLVRWTVDGQAACVQAEQFSSNP